MSHSARRIFGCVAVSFVAPLFAAPSAAQTSPDHDLQMVVGHPTWLPSGRWTSGDDWFALACSTTECALEPARLVVRNGKKQSPGDPRPLKGQVLTFVRKAQSARQPVAWLRGSSDDAPWLRPGPVVSWGSIVGGLRRASSPGTLELEAGPVGGPVARFVPLLDVQNQRCLLQLRLKDERQTLGELSDCQHSPNAGYLLWAGDLDGDGRPDYLVTYVHDGSSAVLYLSSLAASDGLVGVAAGVE